MPRVTLADLESIVNSLSSRLPDHVHVELHRTEMCEVLEYRKGEEGWQLDRCLIAGTKTECYDACFHMIRGIDLAGRGLTR